ncbi:MAG: hypothetical protein A2511_11550 [Deltaproteobacteria bacterium RIFOXYD12_FULL_50_9]|nr:MAG: hypothetical protein A2511_11550 [Deltaproteobacteria bacterium RIFOXYD12_FULL_50_9]
MDQVLIVDDDEGFLLSLKDMLAGGRQNFGILTAGNGLEALKVLGSTTVNLVVTDLKMPEMDGFDLLANISTSHPDLPVIVMTAYGTPEMENRLKDMGAFQYIEKPIDFNILLNKINDGLSSGAKGQIDGISLSSFMQLLQLDKKTCTLTIHYQGRSGFLYFQQGELINAVLDNLTGLGAAIEMASWDQVRIEFTSICKNMERTINVPLGFILIESARQKDELGGAAPSAEEVDSEAEAAETNRMIAVEKILHEAHLDDLDFDASEPVGNIEEDYPGVGQDQVDVALDHTYAPAAVPERQAKQPALSKEASDLESLIEAIDGVQNVNRMIVIGKNGIVLAKKNVEIKKFGNFVAYAAATAAQFGNGLGFTATQQMVMSQSNSDKILVLIGPQIIVGLEVQSSIAIAPIANMLRPLIVRIIV